VKPKYVNVLNFVNNDFAGVLVLFETLGINLYQYSYIFWYVIVSVL